MQVVAVLALMFSVVFGGLVLLEVMDIGSAGASITGLVGTFFNLIQPIGMIWFLGLVAAILVGALGLLLAANRR